MGRPSLVPNQGKSWETTCAVALKYNYLYMHNKSPTKLARKITLYKNRITPAHEVSLCSELDHFHVLWRVLSLNKSALSLYAINSVCSVQFFVHDHQEPGYLCPPVTDVQKMHCTLPPKFAIAPALSSEPHFLPLLELSSSG